MYIKDGSNKDYAGDMRHCGFPLFKNKYAFGWLNPSKKNPKREWESEELKNKVINALKHVENDRAYIVDLYCGFEVCGFCNEKYFCGSIKISHNDKVYITPNGVSHYIESHNYCPDKEVVDAILNGHYYTEDELKSIGITDKDVQYLQKRAEKAEKKREEDRKKDEAAFMEARTKLVNDPKWQEKLQKAMLRAWDFVECD